eukprot:GHVL01011619.1.p1 GENE.GHVL01011619.1~~GHVL01011619.1.p1  ORF type:complete len:177 (+),score=29.44 GHVL01011619.1:153-683(+)
MGGETDFDCNWTTRVQDMELQDKLLVWLKLWNSVESDSKKAFMKQFLKEGNPSLGIVGNFNTRCMMSLASSRGKSIKKIDISHVNQELQEFDFKMKKKLNDDDTAVLSVFENKDDFYIFIYILYIYILYIYIYMYIIYIYRCYLYSKIKMMKRKSNFYPLYIIYWNTLKIAKNLKL